MPASHLVFVGICGHVLALDRATGTEVWRRKLKGSEFVGVVLDNDDLLASARGEVFRLDPATGQVLWNNPLRGMGWGLVSIATPATSSGAQPALAAERRRRAAAAATSA